jgi:hypothetical protein
MIKKQNPHSWTKRDSEVARKIKELALLEIAKWVADFDCEVECFNKAMETHPGVELCMPCRAREILGE